MAAEPITSKVSEMSFQSLIMLGSDRGLLSNSWDKWKVYQEARNKTSHTYNQPKAEN